MLTAVHIHTEQGQILQLPLDALDASSPYLVKDIEGLGPVKADISTSSFVSMPGGVFQAANIGMRNIVIQLGFNPTFQSTDPYGELRRGLYNYVAPEAKVELRFISNNFETVKISGIVESLEPSIFTDEPEVQISILCPDPHFSSLLTLTANRIGTGSLTINNPGNVPVGFRFILNEFSSPATNAFILTRTAPKSASMKYVGSLYIQGELMTVRINTIKGQKSAKWHNATSYNPAQDDVGLNVLGYIEGWLELLPGVNTINVDIASSGTPATATSLFKFTPKFLGL